MEAPQLSPDELMAIYEQQQQACKPLNLDSVVIVPGVGPMYLGECTKAQLLAAAEAADNQAREAFRQAAVLRKEAERRAKVGKNLTAPATYSIKPAKPFGLNELKRSVEEDHQKVVRDLTTEKPKEPKE